MTPIRLDQEIVLFNGHGATGRQVTLVGMDEHAWYSVLSTEEHVRRLLIWPKQIWTTVQDAHLGGCWG